MKALKRVKLEVDGLSEPELLSYGRSVQTKLNDSTTFDPLDSKITMLGNALDLFDARIKNLTKKETELDEADAQLGQQRQEVINILASLGSGVEQIAEGETTIVLASGFDVQPERTSVGALGAPQNLRLYFADMGGQIRARWNTVRGARSYIIEYSPENGGEWKQAGFSTKVNFTLTGLESGKRYRVRVCAIGTLGQGPWSDEALKMAA